MDIDKIESHSPLVSVVMTTYNRSTYLLEAISSIANQTYNNLEILLIDDGSIDTIAAENKAICDKFPTCNYYYKENSGQPDSRNFGIKKSKGTYIGFCDDDDTWAKDKLAYQIKVLNENKNIGLVTCYVATINPNSINIGNIKTYNGKNIGYVFKYFLIKNRMSSPTPLIRKEVFVKTGYFNKNFTIAEDWEFWRRVSYYYEFDCIKEVLAYVRVHNENMSRDRTGELLEKFVLYRKLTKSLLFWGKGRFDKNDKELVEYIEWCHYRKLMQNHLPGFIRKLSFVLSIIFTNTISLFYLLKLYIKYNSKYKPQS